MTIALAGVLPVSAINLGLVASIGGLQAEVTKLQADLSKLGIVLAAQVEITSNFPPNPVALGIVVGAQLDPVGVAAQFAPGNWATMGAEVNSGLVTDLGIVNAQIATLNTLTATLGAGLSAGNLSGWTYAGRAAGFGSQLDRASSNGFGGTAAATQIQAVIIATESFDSWGSFSTSLNTGDTAETPAEADDETLAFLGALDGDEWNTGVQNLLARFQLLIAELEGLRSGLEASIQVSLGLNLPDPQAVVDAGLDVFGELGADGLADNLVNAQADVNGAIALLQAKIDGILALISDIQAQLSAGGLAFWTYSGRAGNLGAEFRSEMAGGVPDGSGPKAVAYGLVVAGSAPEMTTFGNVFKTA